MSEIRWRFVGTGEKIEGEINTISLWGSWTWEDYAEAAGIAAGLSLWALAFVPAAWILLITLAATTIIGFGLRTDEQAAQRLLSRLFTICELVAFLGIIILPIARLFHH